MFLPDSIRVLLPQGESTLDSVGCSSAQVTLFADRVLKVEKDCNSSANELNMMRWLQGKLPVPQVIAAEKADDTRYLLMSRMPGKYLCDEAILDDQERLAELVADGLRRMWAVDVSDCPTDRTLDAKFREIEAGIRSGTITMDTARQEETYGPSGFSSPTQLFDWLVKHRPAEKKVLSHGDYCLPNIFCDDAGLTGYIDLGYAGVADKWVDIEQVLWSMWANSTGQFGGKVREFDRKLLFNALGMEVDEDKLRYYSLLSELC